MQFFESFKMKNMKVSFRAKEQSEIGMSMPFELQSYLARENHFLFNDSALIISKNQIAKFWAFFSVNNKFTHGDTNIKMSSKES